jgi:maleate isomerase
MAPGRLVTPFVRVSSDQGGAGGGPGSSAALRALTAPFVLDQPVELLLAASVDVVGYASTTSAYAIGFDAEAAMVPRLSRLLGVPVAARARRQC